MDTKVCRICEKELPTGDFRLNKDGNYHSYCRKCDNWRRQRDKNLTEEERRLRDENKQKEKEKRASVTELTCTMCNETKSKEHFCSGKTLSGKKRICKSCKSKVDKDYKEKIRGQEIDYAKLKECPSCHEVLPVGEFQISNGLVKTYCLICTSLLRKAHYSRNKEHEALTAKRYRAENKEFVSDISKNYRRNHLDQSRTWCRMRHARKRNYQGVVEKVDTQLIRTMQQGLCVYCGADLVEGYHIDHIVPLSKGGQHVQDNIQLLCPSCNLSKGPKHPDLYEAQIGFDRTAWEAKFGRCLSAS